MKHKLNKKFFIASFITHLVVFLLLFIFNSDNKIHNKFLVYGAHSKKPTHAYFKSLKAPNQSRWLEQRAVVKKQNKTNKSKAKTQKKSPVKVAKKTPEKKAIPAKPKELKKTEPSNAKAMANKQKKVEPPKPKKIEKKATIENKKTVQEKPKQIIKKEAPKKIEKIIEKPQKVAAKEKQSEPYKKEIKQEQKEESIKIEEPENEPEEILEEELHFNLMGAWDPDLIRYQRHIQTEVERLWRPPVGVPKGTECTICFIVNQSGKIEKFEIIKHSKVLIYDLSISRIAKNFKFDRCLWGKKFTIDFRQ